MVKCFAVTDAIEQGIAANASKRPSAVSADTVRGQNDFRCKKILSSKIVT